MTAFDIAVFALKLAFGTLAFLFIGTIGASDNKRVAGAMLAFPVLNGIGLIASSDRDPVALTHSMMPMIALNGVLFFSFIVAFRVCRRRMTGTGDRALSYGVGLAGAAIWFLLAWHLMPRLEPVLPSPGWWILLYGIVTAIMTLAMWGRHPLAPTAPSATRLPLITFWWRRRWRVAFFVASLFLLLAMASIGTAEWIGRLSALPLVPLCVLAGLAIDERDSLPAVRDAIFIGPWVAMVFVLGLMLMFAHAQAFGGLSYWAIGIVSLAIGWIACFFVIRIGMPPLAAALDRRH